MEGPDVPAAAEPQKVRNPKPRKQNSAGRAQQGVQGQEPSIRKSNRGSRAQPAPPAPPAQPEVANWDYHQGDGYGNVDPAHHYPEDYGYENYDGYGQDHGYAYGQGHGYSQEGHGQDAAHGYAYGQEGYGQDAAHGYGYGQEGYVQDAAHGYSYGQNAAHGYGYGQEGYAHDAAHGYGYGQEGYAQDAVHGYGYGQDAAHGYGYGQEYGYGGAEANAGANYGYTTPTQPATGKARKPRKPKPVAADGEPHGAGYENQADQFGQSLQGGYADGYAYPEAHNAFVPEQQPSAKPPKRESKHRKPSRTKSIDSANPGDGEGSVASRALSAERDGAGSSRSTGSSRSKPDRSDRSVHADGSRHPRASSRLEEEEGSIPRGARDQHEEGSGRSNPERRKPKVENEVEGSAKPMKASNPEVNALNEHIRKTGGGKPTLEQEGSTTRNTTDHNENGSGRSNLERLNPKLENEGEGSTKSTKSSDPEVNALNEHLRKTGGGKPAVQDVSMAVFDPRDQATRVFGTPVAAPQARSSLDEWMKKQGDQAGPKFKQEDSLVVFDDHDKSELETRVFGAPLATTLPPVEEKSWNPPQPRQRREIPQQPEVVDLPLYQPSRQRRAYVEPDFRGSEVYPGRALEVQPFDGGAIRTGNRQPLQKKPQPNAKCMACVHGVGVPVARLATRIACNQCMCTIL